MQKKSKVPLSAKEEALLALLPRDGSPIKSTELTRLLYLQQGEPSEPFYAQVGVTSAMNSLIRKMEYNGEPIEIIKTPRAGPKPIEYSMRRKKRWAKR